MIVPVIIRRLLRHFLVNDLLQSSREIYLQRIPRPCVFVMFKPMSKVNGEEDRDANIGGQEAARAPSAREEDVEAVDQGHYCKSNLLVG